MSIGKHIRATFALAATFLVTLLVFGPALAQEDPCWGLNRYDCNQHPDCEWPTGTFGHCYFIYHSYCDCRDLSAVVSNLCDESAELVDGPFDFEYYSGDMSNDYDQMGACTGWPSAGPDAVLYVNLEEGGQLTVHMAPVDQMSSYDASLYLVTDCADPVNTCVIGSDVTVGGGEESFVYESIGGGIYYIIFDAYAAPTAEMIHVWGEVTGSAVPVQPTSWGLLKSLYR